MEENNQEEVEKIEKVVEVVNNEEINNDKELNEEVLENVEHEEQEEKPAKKGLMDRLFGGDSILANSYDEDFSKSDFTIEENNYSKFSYKKLQKLRIDGVAFGVDIPTLKYDLKKPEKRRKVFYVYGIITAIILGLVSYLAVASLIGLLPTILEGTGAVMEVSDNQIISILSLGLSDIFLGTMSILIWGLVLLYVVLLICLISYLAFELKLIFNLTNCSVQEMSVGYQVKDLIGRIIGVVVISGILLGVLIYGYVTGGQISAQVIIITLIILAIFGYSVSLLTFVLIAKKKAKEEFKTLPQELQDNFIDHTKAISRVKYKMSKMRDSSDNNSWNFY